MSFLGKVLAGKIKEKEAEAMPLPESFKGKTFYHGTPTKERAEKILHEGLKAPDLIDDKRGKLKPVKGRVYLTTHIDYAQIYALGGNLAGSSGERLVKEHGQYGYVFLVNGNELKEDVQPDEDIIGEAIADFKFKWLTNLAEEKLTAAALKKVRQGFYGDWAAAGKKLVKFISSKQMEEIMEWKGHTAHLGDVKPFQVWRIDRNDCSKLLKNGSNFFEIATKVKGNEL